MGPTGPLRFVFKINIFQPFSVRLLKIIAISLVPTLKQIAQDAERKMNIALYREANFACERKINAPSIARISE
jgi:hypothetical protein